MPPIVNVLPLYRHVSGAWVKDTPAADLSGTIAETQIAANAVTAAKIAVGAIDASKIQDAVVSNAKLVNDAVSEAKIAAGAITASKLTLSDLTNFAGHQDMTDEDFWSKPTGVSFITGSSSWESARLMKVTGAASSWSSSYGRAFLVEPGQEIYLSYQARVVAGSGGCYADVQVSASPDFSSPQYLNVGIVASSWPPSRMSGTKTIPAGMTYARVRIIKQNNGATECHVGSVVCRLAAGARLIVDGSIDADKIAANSVTSAKITAGAVDADKIAAGAVLADKIGANAVTADKISVSSLSAISANLGTISVGSANIANASISTLKIAGSAVDTARLAGAAVSEYTRVVNGTDYSTFSSALTTLRSYSVPAGFIIIQRLYARWKMATTNSDTVELLVKVGANTVFSYTGVADRGDGAVFRTDDRTSLSFYLPSATAITFQARKTSDAQSGRQVILDYHIVECVVLKR